MSPLRVAFTPLAAISPVSLDLSPCSGDLVDSKFASKSASLLLVSMSGLVEGRVGSSPGALPGGRVPGLQL